MTGRETTEQTATIAAVRIALADLAKAVSAEVHAAITKSVPTSKLRALVEDRRSKGRWIGVLGWAIRRVLDTGSGPVIPTRPDWRPSLDDLRDEFDAAVAFSPDAEAQYRIEQWATYLTPTPDTSAIALEPIKGLDDVIAESDAVAVDHIDTVVKQLEAAQAHTESIDEVIARLAREEAAEDTKRAAESDRVKAQLAEDQARNRLADEVGKTVVDAGRDAVRAGASLDDKSIGFVRVPGEAHSHCGFCLALASNPPLKSTRMKPGDAAYHANCGCQVVEVASWGTFKTDPRFFQARRAKALLTEATEHVDGGDGWAGTLDRFTRPDRYAKTKRS